MCARAGKKARKKRSKKLLLISCCLAKNVYCNGAEEFMSFVHEQVIMNIYTKNIHLYAKFAQQSYIVFIKAQNSDHNSISLYPQKIDLYAKEIVLSHYHQHNIK